MMRWLLGIVLVLAGAVVLSLVTLGPGGGPLLRPADFTDPAVLLGKLRARLSDAPAPGAQAARIYKWRDAAGRWHYDQSPPPAGTAYEVMEADPDANLLPALREEERER